MKLKLLFIFCLSIFISCSNDDNLNCQNIDSTKIAEYHIGNDITISQRYVFNSDGELSIFYHYPNNYAIHYHYDSDYKLVNFTKNVISTGITIESKDVLYDLNNRVTQIGTKVYTYNSVDNYYTTDLWSNSYSADSGNLDINEYSFKKYNYSEYNLLNPIIQMEYIEGGTETYLPTGNVNSWEFGNEDFSHTYHHNGENLISEQNWYGPGFEYDTNTNPLKSNQSNLYYVFGLMHDTSQLHSHLNILINTNNKLNLQWDNDGGPESNEYYYNFNTNGLPVKGYSRELYGGIPETDWYHSSSYYYQGDVIPTP